MKAKIKKKLKGSLFILSCVIVIFSIGCKKEEPQKTPLETSTMTDVEGNVYKTVKIGNQWWMAEDLKVKKYRNGQDIKSITDNNVQTWSSQTKGATCVYENSTGRLYNWYAIKDSNNIAPKGWHIPTDAEWKALEKQLGMSGSDVDKVNWRGTHEGEKLKKEGTSSWAIYKNVWATNESGFTATAGGCRMFDGRWSDPIGLKFMGFWWSSSENNEEAFYRHLDYKSSGIFRYYGPKTYGFSIRCVKD